MTRNIENRRREKKIISGIINMASDNNQAWQHDLYETCMIKSSMIE